MKFIMGVIIGIVVSGILFVVSLPHCPTEDACEPDYRHHTTILHYGYWTGREVTP